MKIRPLHDRVIVKRVEAESTTASRHRYPGLRRREARSGRSAGCRPRQGARQRRRPHGLDVKVGDRVLFGKYAGQTVKVDGQEVLVMREEDIMGVIEA